MTEPQMTPEPVERLVALVESGDGSGLRALVDALQPGDLARALSMLEEQDQSRVFTLLGPESAAGVVEELAAAQAADIIEDLPVEQAAAIIDELPSDEQTDLLSELDREDAEAILAQMSPEEVRDVKRLSQYGPDTAGGVMATEYLSFPDTFTVQDVLADMRANAERYQEYDVQYAYVVDALGRLVGVLRLRDLVLSPGGRPVTHVMIASPHRVPVSAVLDDLEEFFDRHDFFAAPVVDPDDRLVGVVQRSTVEEALSERSEKMLMRWSGIIAGEEIRTMPLGERATRRLAFLVPNIGLSLAAAMVIAVYEPVLAQVTALMIFLPVISGMSGNSGFQAAAVSMREQSLGLINTRDFMRVWVKELQIGSIVGLCVGVILAVITIAMRGNPYLGLVVGGAMAINNLVAVTTGGLLPLVLRRFRIDPALASGPVLTTITDMFGFFLALTFAYLMLPLLR